MRIKASAGLRERPSRSTMFRKLAKLFRTEGRKPADGGWLRAPAAHRPGSWRRYDLKRGQGGVVLQAQVRDVRRGLPDVLADTPPRRRREAAGDPPIRPVAHAALRVPRG